MPGNADNILFDVSIIRETEKAFLLEITDQDITAWFPKSQVEVYLDNGKASIPKWLCEKHDLSIPERKTDEMG